MRHGVTFKADQYDQEVARIGSDHRWERPQDTTARLIRERADRNALAARGLRIPGAAADYRDASKFVVSFMTVDNNFQVLALLQKPSSKWTATYHSIPPKVTRITAQAS